jgi:integrase
MAALRFKNGYATVQFTLAKKRRTLRLGKVDRRAAEKARLHIEQLVAAKDHGTIPTDTREYLDRLSDRLYSRFVRVGLVEARQAAVRTQLKPFLDSYIDGRTDLKQNTLENLSQVRRGLVEFFSHDRFIDSITRGDVKDWHRRLKESLAPATVAMHVKKARQFFADAIDRKLLTDNPFKAVRAGKQTNAERQRYIPAADVMKIIAACPDAEWRLLFALARWGCLRVTSETHVLRWADIDWQALRMTVRASKTEHHEGGGVREVPILPEIKPYLIDVLEAAPDGAEYVFDRLRLNADNLRTQAQRLIRRAGLTPWPKTFQNLRSSGETDLTLRFPLHVACAWAGNSEVIARRHYLQVTDDHYRQAVGESDVKSATESAGNDRKKAEPVEQKQREMPVNPNSLLPPRGGEHDDKTLRNLRFSEKALRKALHRLSEAAPHIRQSEINRLQREVNAAKGVAGE